MAVFDFALDSFPAFLKFTKCIQDGTKKVCDQVVILNNLNIFQEKL